jgi:hypothetical protein
LAAVDLAALDPELAVIKGLEEPRMVVQLAQVVLRRAAAAKVELLLRARQAA